MNTRERFKAVMNFEKPDRLPMLEWAVWWHLTVERWQQEGLAVSDRYELYEHFGLEQYRQTTACPFAKELCNQVPPGEGMPLLEDEVGYERLLPLCYPEELPEQTRDELNTWKPEHDAGDSVVWLTIWGYFGWPRFLFGIQPHFFAFYDQPELMHRMNEACCRHHLRIIDQACAIDTPDFVTVGEDMSYNNGPMLSKEQFDEFLAPYYRRLTDKLHEHGILCIVDSDGDVSDLAGWLQNCGVDGILPLERQAGCDLDEIQKLYPDMRFIGHFDKLTMHRGEAAMRGEFERLMPAMRHGGYIPSVDHQTPPGVSLQDYELYIRLLREYMEKAGV